MASSYVTAAHVGSYFVTQYYSMLQQTPEFVHQLYSDASTMLRIHGHSRETASAMLVSIRLIPICFPLLNLVDCLVFMFDWIVCN